MLNELYVLAKSLEKCGLNPPTYHPSLKRNAKKDGFVLGIEDDGSVGFVEFCEAQKMGEVWRIESGSNGISFPGFNLASPIWKPMDNVAEIVQKLLKLPKNHIQERLELLGTICQHSVLAYSDSQKKQLQSNLREFPARLWQIFSDSIPGYEAFSDLLSCLIKSTYAIDEFLQMLTDTSLRLCREGRLGAVLEVERLLLGNWNKKKEEFATQTIPVGCEVANRSDYQQIVVSLAMEKFVNARLQERMPGKDFTASRVNTVERRGIDAFVGTEAVLESRFPSPTLPRLGKTILMSMSKESPCQTRYGLQDSDTFPVGKNVSEVMQNALLFLIQDEREGRTWYGVPNQKGKQDLLISYLEDKPDSTALLASLFAESANLIELEEAQFESIAAKVCTALKGEVGEKTDAIIRVIVLSSPDPGRRQLILSEAYRVEEIFRAAEDWQLAAANHPEIKVLLPPTRQQKARLVDPFPPFPTAMMTCLNVQWTHEASNSQNIASCDLQQIYEVFLKQTERSRSTSGHLLSLALQRTSNLLLALGHRQHCGSQKDLSAKARITALTVISSLSILLYKQGRRKDIFMNKTSFNLGRLLSFADQLHFIYCKEVRDNQIPPQLLGNALMNTALQRPATALALFAQRILPYQAWARTVQEGKNVGLAKYFLKEMAIVSQTLIQASLPETLSDEDRAEMILGYLASSTSNNQ